MTDDLCGYETPNGPCQNPATEGDSCWIESHGGFANPGRDFVIDESDHEAILQAARDGLSKSGCARAAGTGPDQLQRYLEADENADFREAFARARQEGERELVRGALFDLPEDEAREERTINGQHARFLLSTSFDYVKTEKRELENTGDEPLSEVVVDFTDVDT